MLKELFLEFSETQFFLLRLNGNEGCLIYSPICGNL